MSRRIENSALNYVLSVSFPPELIILTDPTSKNTTTQNMTVELENPTGHSPGNEMERTRTSE